MTIIKVKLEQPKAVHPPKNGRARKLYAEYLSLKEDIDKKTIRLEEIKKEIREGISTPNGFILCCPETGEGFRKTTSERIQPDEELMKKNIPTSLWNKISTEKRIFDPEKATQAIANKLITAKDFRKKCCKITPIVSIRLGKEREEEK